MSSLVTGNESHNRETSTAGSSIHAAVTSGQALKGRLAATFNLTADEGQQLLLGNQQRSSYNKRQASESNKSRGKQEAQYKC